MKDYFLKWMLPFTILLVIIYQLFNVYTNSLTRWKGGGFGMYSQIHPLDKRVWIVTEDSSWVIHNRKNTLGKLASKLRFYPNEKAMQNFAYKVATTYNINNFSVEIWEPYIITEKNELARRLTAKIIYKN